MKRKHHFLKCICFVFFLLGLSGALIAAQEAANTNTAAKGQVSLEDIPDGPLTQEQMQKLFANRTAKGTVFKGTKDRKDLNFIRYFNADGALFEKSNQPERRGRWTVLEDRLCINWQNQNEYCHKIIKGKNGINEYRVKKSGEQILMATYSQFWEGESGPQ